MIYGKLRFCKTLKYSFYGRVNLQIYYQVVDWLAFKRQRNGYCSRRFVCAVMRATRSMQKDAVNAVIKGLDRKHARVAADEHLTYSFVVLLFKLYF